MYVFCRSALQARFYLDAGSRARAARHFLLRAQEKVPKEKGTRRLARFQIFNLEPGPLCFSRKPALTQLVISLRSITQTSVSFIRFSLRCSVAPTGSNSKPRATIYVGRVKRSVPVRILIYLSRRRSRASQEKPDEAHACLSIRA